MDGNRRVMMVVYLFLVDDIGEEDGEELMQDKDIEERPS